MCRGKLLNVRDAGVTQINGNAEINAIKQILGLQHGKVTPPALSGTLASKAHGAFNHRLLINAGDTAEL